MEISKWGISGMVIGFLFTLTSIVRYYVLYPDMDKALSYGIIGILIMAVSYLYACKLRHSNRLTSIEDYLGEKTLMEDQYGNS